jgi:G6PDH family F420-dependent oxidoreductase
MVAVEPQKELVDGWDAAHPGGSRKIGQIPVCWAPTKEDAERLAHEQFRWSGLGWPVNAELPTPASFASATASLPPSVTAEAIACGPDIDELAESFRPWIDAGFTDIALVQVGDELQSRFLAEAAGPLLEALRAL